MKALLRKIGKRLRSGLATLPKPRDWLELAVHLALFALAALLLGTEFLDLSETIRWSEVLPLAARVLLIPALLEEVVFRGSLNPHPTEGAGRRQVISGAVISLIAYTVLHPLNGALLLAISDGEQQAARVFLDAEFLALVLLLGLSCLILYRRSGSLWTPTFMHALVVTAWLSLGGSGLLPSP